MPMKKRVLCLFILLAMLLSLLSACGGDAAVTDGGDRTG